MAKLFKDTIEFFDYHLGRPLGWRDPLQPPRWLHAVGKGRYFEVGEEFVRYFIELAGLKPDERVLDVGCGTGRIAGPLTKHLTRGTYDGIDIVAKSIAWCQKAYAPRHPHFKFHFSDIYNKYYNPKGTQQSSEYRFPFADAAFDFVFLTSVFTHMLPRDMENYLSEISRVLRPGGRCLITYFLLNEQSLGLMRAGKAGWTFNHELNGCYVAKPEMPEAAIAYDEQKIRDFYQGLNLAISEPIRYGSWSGRTDGLSFQDIVLAYK